SAEIPFWKEVDKEKRVLGNSLGML
ncbi:MAG: hypothetical protein RLZZ343_1423, partial [Actinomycetota bacterium]